MSNTIDIVVNFKDNTTWIFEGVIAFERIIHDSLWRIETDHGDCSYIPNSEVRFIGHKHLWDKMIINSFNEPVEEGKCAEKEPPLHNKGCWFCKHTLTCDKQREYADSLMEPNRCPYYEQDF